MFVPLPTSKQIFNGILQLCQLRFCYFPSNIVCTTANLLMHYRNQIITSQPAQAKVRGEWSDAARHSCLGSRPGAGSPRPRSPCSWERAEGTGEAQRSAQGGLGLSSAAERGLHGLGTRRCAARLGTGRRTASAKAKQQRQQRVLLRKQTAPKPQQPAPVHRRGSGEKNPSTTHLKRSPNLLLR